MTATNTTPASDHPDTDDAHVGIAELGDWCARRRATFLDLFESLGTWATADDTPPGPTQQLWVTACHRHAWHAELCAERAPTVPIVDLNSLTDGYRGRLDTPDPDSRLPWYLLAIDGVLVACTSLGARIDPQLDPSTVRMIDLLVHDLDDLRRRAMSLLAPA